MEWMPNQILYFFKPEHLIDVSSYINSYGPANTNLKASLKPHTGNWIGLKIQSSPYESSKSYLHMSPMRKVCSSFCIYKAPKGEAEYALHKVYYYG